MAASAHSELELSPTATSDPAAEPRWPAWGAPIALIAWFVGELFVGVIVGVLAALAGASFSHPGPALNLVVGGLGELVFLGVAFLFARMTVPPRPWHFGLRPTPVGGAARWMGTAIVVFIGASVIYSQLVGVHARDTLPSRLGDQRGAGYVVAIALLVTVVAPIAEEIFFRGYLFGALRRWAGPWGAAILVGILFGVAHYTTPGAAPFLGLLAIFGFLLCVVRWRTDSLYPGMALHALNNAIALAVFEGWTWWQAAALAIGANVAIAAIAWPLGRGAPRRAPVPAPIG